MRVLYFTRDYTPHDFRFLSSLAGHGHRVSSLRLERQGMRREERPLPPEVEQIEWSGGRAPFKWTQLPGLAAELRRIVDEIDPDVIHAGPIPLVSFTAALAGVRPLVSMSWGSDLLLDTVDNPWARLRARFALRRTDVMIGDCAAVRDRAVELGFPAEQVVLFPWGVDLGAFSPRQGSFGIEPSGWEEDGFILLSLRAWEPLYGVDMLVRAFARAAVQEPALRLVLLGGGSQESLIRGTIHEAHMEEKVFLGGQVSNQKLVQYYRAADLYLSASHSDGSSVSLMEALACGLPVLVSDIPGNAEWITPGEQGWLFPDGDEAALAQTMLRAYNERSRLPTMRRAARILAEKRADWTTNYRQLERAYELAAGMYVKTGSL